MASKIQVRRDTLSNWNANNPVLSSGEIAFVTDENKFKVGNGSSAFSSLPYLQADAYIDSVILGTDTTGNYVETMISGDGISLSGQGSESASVTVTNTGVLSLTGTTNEVEVSASTGNITLSIPTTINANTTGTAASLTTARTIALSGDISGSASFDGSASVDIVATIQPDSVSLGSDTTGNYVSQVTGTGAGISVSGSGESASVTIENTGVTSLYGTANEVDVSASSGSITISLPSVINADTTGSAATLTTSRIIELTGDISGSASFNGGANASITSTLANTTVTPDSYGSASAVGIFTVDSKGRLTSASNTPIAITQSAVANLTTDLSSKAPLASPTFTGTVSASAINISIADTATAASHYVVETGSDGVLRPKTLANVRTEIVTTAAVNSAAATTLGTVTSGTWEATDIGLAHGGTNASLTAESGAVVYSTASALALTGVGTAGQVLTSNGAGAPTWQAAASSGFDGFFLAGM